MNNQTSLQDSRGPADFDRTHRLIFNYTWELPLFRQATGFKHALFGGWHISGITTFQSGSPFTVLDSAAAGAYGLLGTGTPTTPNFVMGVDPMTSGSVTTR